MLRCALASYRSALAARPLLTKIATGGSLSAAGDTVAQLGTEDRFDPNRLAGFTAFGVFYVGGFNHFWFNWLAFRFPGQQTAAALTKVGLQQFVANPFAYVPALYLMNGAANGQTLVQITHKASEEYTDVMVKLWQTWIPSSLFQFFIVPPQYHVLWAAGVGFGWNVYLSMFYYQASLVTGAHNKPSALV